MDPVVKYLNHCGALFEIFGHQYFSLKSLTAKNRHDYPSLSYTIYFLLVFVVLTSQMVIFTTFAASSENLDVKLNSKTVLNIIVQHSMYIGLIIIICVSLIQSFVSTPLTKKLYMNCINISQMCAKDFGHVIDHRRIRRYVLKYFIFIISFFLMTQFGLYSFGKSRGDSADLLQTCIIIIPMIFLHSTAFKFMFYVKILNIHLEAINSILPGIFDVPKLYNGRGIIPVVNLKLQEISGLSIKIQKLRRVYIIICENAELINRTMGKTVLIIIFVMVVAIIASGYRLFLAMVGKLPIEKVGGEIESIALKRR